MPRVNRDNRDLQRRLAARRGRERRRPSSEPRYSFAPAETVETPPDTDQETDDGRPEVLASQATSAAVASAKPAARANYRPFTDYRQEYAYVASDLRRIAVVVGSLLVVLILLHFLLLR
ncbi:MAG TPA: hypothetical protein VFG86_00285 [Chloroflexota bacterium]|jgi:hypothetical protein|nr:hypothetical protein [Chloroflexota bacterium]